MKYYENLKSTRIDLDISQAYVAKKLGTTQQQIYKYENGLNSMTVERLIDFCKLYNVSADYILGIGGKKNTANSTKYVFLFSYKSVMLGLIYSPRHHFLFSLQQLLTETTEIRYRDKGAAFQTAKAVLKS